jgi:hypothetical protein
MSPRWSIAKFHCRLFGENIFWFLPASIPAVFLSLTQGGIPPVVFPGFQMHSLSKDFLKIHFSFNSARNIAASFTKLMRESFQCWQALPNLLTGSSGVKCLDVTGQ